MSDDAPDSQPSGAEAGRATAASDPRPARRPRRRKRGDPFYSVLQGKEEWERRELADPSLGQEIGILRLKVAAMLNNGEKVDWKAALRMLEVLVRMVRIQQGLPAAAAGREDPLQEFGRQLEELFGVKEEA